MSKVTVTVYKQTGDKAKDVTLSELVFGQPLNRDLVHQVMVSMKANSRLSTANTKDRSEVSGTGKKPWKQKGTGRARHGSRRSPIWVGGGIAHGPTSEKDFSQKVNRKMKAKALYSALSAKLRAGKVLFVDQITMGESKTKVAEQVMLGLSKVSGFETMAKVKKTNNVLLLTPESDMSVKKAIANLPYVTCKQISNLSVVDVLDNRYLVVINPEVADEKLSLRMIVNRKKKLTDEAESSK